MSRKRQVYAAVILGAAVGFFLGSPLLRMVEKGVLAFFPYGWEVRYQTERGGETLAKETRAHARIHFLDDPSPLRDPDQPFFMSMEGVFIVKSEGQITFIARGDDRFRLYLDGDRVIDHWGNRRYRGSKQTYTRTFPPGTYDLRIEFEQVDGPARVQVTWTQDPWKRERPLGWPWIKKP